MSYQVQVLPGKYGLIPNNLKGFDCNTKLNSTIALEFVKNNYEFVVRYLTIGEDQNIINDLDYYEAVDILNAGLGLMAVQHVRYPGWKPNVDIGIQDGNQARKNALYVGFPAGVNIWLDLEGVSNASSYLDIIAYCNAWYQEVSEWGYVPGLYVGANCGLTAEQLYEDLLVSHYWKSLSIVPTPTSKGFVMKQSFSDPVNGVSIDQNTTQIDLQKVQAKWLHL